MRGHGSGIVVPALRISGTRGTDPAVACWETVRDENQVAIRNTASVIRNNGFVIRFKLTNSCHRNYRLGLIALAVGTVPVTLVAGETVKVEVRVSR